MTTRYKNVQIYIDPKDHKQVQKKLKKDCGERASLSQFFRLMEWSYLNDKNFANNVSETLNVVTSMNQEKKPGLRVQIYQLIKEKRGIKVHSGDIEGFGILQGYKASNADRRAREWWRLQRR